MTAADVIALNGNGPRAGRQVRRWLSVDMKSVADPVERKAITAFTAALTLTALRKLIYHAAAPVEERQTAFTTIMMRNRPESVDQGEAV